MSDSKRSCLDAIDQEFRVLSAPPHSLSVDGEQISPDLPARSVGLEELRLIVLKRRSGDQVKGAVWSYLVRMARARPDPWVVAAMGMMLPGLKTIAARMNHVYPYEINDLDSEISAAFLTALALVDARHPALHTQLYLAALQGGRRACRVALREVSRSAPLPESLPESAAGNPDIALVHAVRDRVVTPAQAALISGVHLDHAPRGNIARRMGISRDRVRHELTAATRGLSTYLSAA